jgi:hypothetical protein
LPAFYQALVEEFGGSDACVINLLWHADAPVAGQLCLQIGTTLNILKVGFSEGHAKFAPGLLLHFGQWAKRKWDRSPLALPDGAAGSAEAPDAQRLGGSSVEA